MTREEFFYKYGCEYKDPNCSSENKKKCSAEFYRDLASVIENQKNAAAPTATNTEKNLIEGLIEEMDGVGAGFASTAMEFYRNGKHYSAVIGVRLVGEERVQQDVE